MDSIRGEKAFAIHKQIIENEEVRRKLMADNARLLSSMYEQEYYKDMLGDENGEWAGYLGQLEIFYTRSRIEYMRRVYKRFTTDLGIPEELWIQAPLTRLIDILHIINKENFEDWISKAMTLTNRDWTIETRKAKGKTTEDDEHKHRDKLYDICGVCGRKTPHHHEVTEPVTEAELDAALAHDEVSTFVPARLAGKHPSLQKKK